MNDIERLQAAKDALKAEYGDRAWFRGVGIAPASNGLCLRLNVDPAVHVADDEIPQRYRGHAVEVVFIEKYEPR